MSLEKEIEANVIRYARTKGVLARKWSSPSHRGVPDRIFVFPLGLVVFVEFKREGGKLTALQQREHDKLRANNAIVHTVYSAPAGKKLIDNYLAFDALAVARLPEGGDRSSTE